MLDLLVLDLPNISDRDEAFLHHFNSDRNCAVRFLTFEFFSPHLNSTFGLDLGEASVELTLTRAQKLPVNTFPGIMREPFSLIFRSSTQVVLPQRLYPFSHKDLGKLDIFIVPIARDPQGVVYQALFN